MYLKTLTCKGFKSFADRSVLNLEPGITAIIGPNGSGKSNVLDAVLWVLGERNARNLRGQAMEDVIFAGSSTRKRVGMAEVNLVLDNSDGTLPVDYNEVSITRRMYRSGDSEYLINGTLCRRMDVLDILHDTGLGTGTHSIISQGHLDSVLQSRPEDRRALIEEAAGVLKHKQRKARSERKLERMDQHLLRIRDINREVERQLKPLERKAKRAITYKGLATELASVSLDLAVDDLRVLQGKWDAVLTTEKELSSLAEEKGRQAQLADAAVQELQADLRRHSEGAGVVAEQLREVSRASEQLDSTVLLLREKKRSSLRMLEQRRSRLDADSQRLLALRDQLSESERALLDVRTEKAAAEETLAAVARERDEVSRAFGDLRREIGALEHDESRLVRDGDRLRAAKEKAADALSSNMADEKLIAAQVQDATRRADEAQQRMDALRERFEQAEREHAQAVEADEACRIRSAEAFAEADAKRKAAEGLRNDDARLSAQVAGLEEGERTAQAANRALSWALGKKQELGARALLLDALRLPADATAIVEALLAGIADALMVDDARAAQAGAASVADAQQEGSAAFMALAGAKRAGVRVELPELSGGVRLVDILACDDVHRDAIERLLGDVVLCDTVGQARACAKVLEGVSGPWRVASKDGFIATSAGIARYIRPAAGSVGVIERHRELENARAEAKRMHGKLAEAIREMEQAEERLRGIQKESLERASARAQAKGVLDSLADQVERLQREIASLQRENEELARRQERNRVLLEQMRPNSERIEAELNAAVEELASVRAQLAAKREDLQPLRKRNGVLNERHTEARLEVGRLVERESYANRMAQGHRGDIARLERQVARVSREAAGRVQIDEIDAIVNALSLVRETVSGRIAGIERRADELRDGSAAIHLKADEKRRESVALRTEAEDATARLADTRVQKGRLELQVEAAIATIKEDCETPLEVALARPELDDRQSAEEHAATLRRRIANLGPINPDAAHEYEELKERHDFLQEQVNDITAARRALEKVARAIDGRMRDDFTETFKAVDENFRRVFAELFPGGSASLSLVEGEDPETAGIEVNAQPRGKRITKMSLMSGGEKSLTALALLFAVYATRPTPFYILDEVEAALDDTNLRRLCGYLDAMRDRTQLIMITHQRRTMEMADVLYGVSMQSDGVTRLISQKLDRAAM